jgi:hypothetical protein
MYESLVFYNHFGNGDLFESREFVKEIMQIIPAEKYYYAHGKSSRMFADIPQLEYTYVTDQMQPTFAFMKTDKIIGINTWIGRGGDYVLPQIGCVIDKNYEMFNDILRGLGLQTLSKHFIEYIPVVDYKAFPIAGVDRFVKENIKRLVLVCNGNVQSLQAENFDFGPVLLQLASNHQDTDFIVTKDINAEASNIIPVSRITDTKDGFDLNEISYLATFCDTIIGRKSGPFVFSHNKDVWYSNKKSLSFTYARHSSHFVQGNDLPLRKFWSKKTDYLGVLQEIERVLDE